MNPNAPAVNEPSVRGLSSERGPSVPATDTLDLNDLLDILAFQSVLRPLGAALEQGRAARKSRSHALLVAAAVRQLALQSVSDVGGVLGHAACGQCVSKTGDATGGAGSSSRAAFQPDGICFACTAGGRSATPAALVLLNLLSKVLMGKN
jgi:hypothetical protein